MLNEEYNIPRAKQEIEKLNRLKTPHEKNMRISGLSEYGVGVYEYYRRILSELENVSDILEESYHGN